MAAFSNLILKRYQPEIWGLRVQRRQRDWSLPCIPASSPTFQNSEQIRHEKIAKNQAKRNRHGVGESTELPSLRRLVNQTIDPGLRIEVNAESKLIGKME